jgi:serine phosphatase RsbU (regulator of sigma subunit)
VLYTDGVSEAMNPQDEEWGEIRMIEAVERCLLPLPENRGKDARAAAGVKDGNHP